MKRSIESGISCYLAWWEHVKSYIQVCVCVCIYIYIHTHTYTCSAAHLKNATLSLYSYHTYNYEFFYIWSHNKSCSLCEFEWNIKFCICASVETGNIGDSAFNVSICIKLFLHEMSQHPLHSCTIHLCICPMSCTVYVTINT